MRVEEVFGVSRTLVESYIERPTVDDAFSSAINDSRQIVIFGSSKQGKSALLEKHLTSKRRTTVHCGPNMSTGDVYRSLLRQNKVEIKGESSSELNIESKASIAAKFTASFYQLVGVGTDLTAEAKAGKTLTNSVHSIEFNLSSAQDVAEIIEQLNLKEHFFVLENFHYLQDAVQSQFAFDLRTFQDLGVRFVVLGVWRERNRLNQYNGDLQDRVIEIPVEPWSENEFQRIIGKGEPALNIKFSPHALSVIFNAAQGSVGVLQEILKYSCIYHDIKEYTSKFFYETDPDKIENLDLIEKAIQKKVEDYASRHLRALETIAAGARTRRETEVTAALYLPYYFVKIMMDATYDELKEGVQKYDLLTRLRAIHPKGKNLRESDLSGMLTRLASLQNDAQISPPLFDYDRATRRIKVVDSTLFFFIKHTDSAEIMADIPAPEVSTS